VRNFKDGIEPSLPGVRRHDITNNDVSECLDDGCEMDYSERNTRLFCNRFTDVFKVFPCQPFSAGRSMCSARGL